MKEFYEKYAPSARTAYHNADTPDEFKRRLEDVLNRMTYATLCTITMDARAHRMDDDASHSILRIDPDSERRASVSLPSPFISDMIIQRVIGGHAEKLREWFDLFMLPRFESRETARWILDSVFRCSLLRKGQCPVFMFNELVVMSGKYHWRVSPPSASPRYMVFHPQTEDVEIRSISSDDGPFFIPTEQYDVQARPNLRSGMCYYQPVQGDQAAFDGFLWSGHIRGLVVVFQAIASEKHTMKTKGLYWLFDLAGVKEVWYVMVTPADLKIDFTVDNSAVVGGRIWEYYHVKMNIER